MESDRESKSARFAISVGSAWPVEDLMLEILKRLAIKSLCRFRCVCKSWNSFISSSILAILHHTFTSSAMPASLKPYLQVPCFRGRIGLRSYDSCALYRPPDDAGALVEHLRHDVRFPFEFRLNVTFVDVVHGVVCVSSSADSTILWNPAIHKYIRVPLPPYLGTVDIDSLNCHALGFGYDRSRNDFKVVRVWMTRLNRRQMFEVYSARQGLWRAAFIAESIIEPGVFDVHSTRTGCFVNGAIHWPVAHTHLQKYSVLMFDCEREDFRALQMPEEMYPYRPNEMELTEYGGRLAALVRGTLRSVARIDLWVMEEHDGLASTWRLLFRIIDNEGESNLVMMGQPSFEKVAPYGPDQWVKSLRPWVRFEQILSDHVYEENLVFDGSSQCRILLGHNETLFRSESHHIPNTPKLALLTG